MYRVEYKETCKYTNRGEVLINDLPVGYGPEKECYALIEELLEDPNRPTKIECVYDIWLDVLAEKGKVCKLSV